MSAITVQNYHDCYEIGKEVFQGLITVADAINEIVDMNPNSARPYITCVVKMLSGETYQSTVKQDAVTFFLTTIYKEYGRDGLEKALNSLKGHLEYQEGKNNLPSLWKVYEDYIEIL